MSRNEKREKAEELEYLIKRLAKDEKMWAAKRARELARELAAA